MLFPSEVFLFVFLPVVYLLYFGVFHRWQGAKNVFLLIASLLFYAYGEPVYVFLMMFMIIFNYFFGLLVHHFREHRKAAGFILAFMALTDLGILGFYKYSDFLIGNINQLCHIHIPQPGLALPIGISFFTFQAISYVIDVYRQRGEVQKNILNVGLYISLFPQLIAGPIVRYETIAAQIKERKETLDGFSKGITRFIIGLGKKVLLANQFAVVSDAAFQNVTADNCGNSVAFLWLGALSYTLQIFFDFAGYSDMAIGLGQTFGFSFEENFRYPYTASSVTKFWQRWHISLQTWFRDYVYFPLGGSRVKRKSRLVFNLFVVWSLTGLWHGANWTFITWGLLYFFLLSLEKLTGFADKLKGFGHLYTTLFVMLGWVLFRSDSITTAWNYLKGMFGIGAAGWLDKGCLQFLRQYGIYYAIGLLCCFPVIKNTDRVLKKNWFWNTAYVIGVSGIAVCSIFFIFNHAYNPFIYFNF